MGLKHAYFLIVAALLMLPAALGLLCCVQVGSDLMDDERVPASFLQILIIGVFIALNECETIQVILSDRISV